MSEANQKDIEEALERIARTVDGILLYRYLQRECFRTMSNPAAQIRALPVYEGRRSFAAELMGYMARGIAENDRDACIVTFARSGGSASSRASARRVTLDEHDVNPLDAIIAEYTGNNGTGGEPS